MAQRRTTRRIHVGEVPVGGGAPIAVQSMTKTRTEDVRATVAQIRRLADAGCEIARVAVPNRRELKAFREIKEKSPLPLIADVHFAKELALGALDAGADGVRVNPGNLGGAADFRQIAAAARRLGRAVRIGVNAGSLDPKLKSKKGLTGSEKMVESALRCVEIAEKAKLRDYKISLKASDVSATVDAYRGISRLCDVPLHVGITEAGGRFSGAIRSAVGIGILLNEGIGDTIRVSLTAPPESEVRAAWEILRSLSLRRRGVEVISCPACSRSDAGDVERIAEKIRKKTASIVAPAKVAVMGCEVNGPGESEGADLAIVLDRSGRARLYAAGAFVRKLPVEKAVDALLAELTRISESESSAKQDSRNKKL
jgi:(E)-4-hydroxy-3-methylbut-2-enyl-diphosphate synthase